MANLAHKILVQSKRSYFAVPSVSLISRQNHWYYFDPHRLSNGDGDHLRHQLMMNTSRLKLLGTKIATGVRCYCAPQFGETKNPIWDHVHHLNSESQLLCDEERQRTIQTIRHGAQHLLGDSDLAQGQSLLCLQVVMKLRHALLEQNFGSATCNLGSGSPLDRIQVVAQILREYQRFWIQSSSIVLDRVDNLHNRVCSSNFRGRVKANDKQSKIYSEIKLLALANSGINDDKTIDNCEQLEDFLRSLVEPCQKIQNVHVTYSNVISIPKELAKCHLRLTGSFYGRSYSI